MPPHFIGGSAHHPRLHQAAHDLVRLFVGALEDARETQAQAAVAGEDVDQIAVQEAVVPDALENQVQLQPDILKLRQPPCRRRQGGIHPRLVAGEQLLDDVVFIAEVVIQIARADFQLIGNMVGGDVGFTLRVEHRKRCVEDALAGLSGHRLGSLRHRVS